MRCRAHACRVRSDRITPALLWLVTGLLIFLAGTACRRDVPVVDTGPRPAQAEGTITGTVRGPEGVGTLEGRTVEAVNVTTGERHRVDTDNAGGFSFKLKAGQYRVDLPLKQGEVLVRRPGVITLGRSDVDAHADFVLGTRRISRPRGPAYRVDDGLGSPIA